MSFIVRNFLNQLSLWQKQKQKKKNKKQLVLKPEKKYEDRGENVTLNVICQIFIIIIIIIFFFFVSVLFFYNFIAIILPHSIFPMKPNSPGIELLPM